MILAGGTSDHRLFFKSLRQEPWGSLGLTLAGGFFLTMNQHGVHQGRATESEPWFRHLKKRFARSSDFTKSAFPLFFFFLNICLFIWLRWVLVGSRGLFYCTVQALQLWCSPVAHGILVPWSGIKPMSPALQGRCWTTGPLGRYLAFPLLQGRVIWGGVGGEEHVGSSLPALVQGQLSAQPALETNTAPGISTRWRIKRSGYHGVILENWH